MNVTEGVVNFLHCGSTSAVDIRLEQMPQKIRSFRILFGTDYTAAMTTIAALALSNGWTLGIHYEDQQSGAEYAVVTELTIER